VVANGVCRHSLDCIGAAWIYDAAIPSGEV
jgi:hypothetical protein